MGVFSSYASGTVVQGRHRHKRDYPCMLYEVRVMLVLETGRISPREP